MSIYQPTSFPIPDENTIVLGMHQSDIIVRTALTVALADIRANPWLLDFVFASLKQDPVTKNEYGENFIQKVKEWFLKTNIPVMITPTINESQWPAISISLASGDEIANEDTLGDVHSLPFEDNASVWPALVVNYSPNSYDQSSGTLYFPESPPNNIILAEGMYIVDNIGQAHKILEVVEDNVVLIQPGTVADFKNSSLKGQFPSFVTSIESISERESYVIGVHVPGEPTYLPWLFSIIKFCLLRYKEVLLEARGFERSVLKSSDFGRREEFETELVFSRYITITGYIRQYWPKAIYQKIDAVRVVPQIIDGDTIANTGVDPETQTWVGDEDSLTFRV